MDKKYLLIHEIKDHFPFLGRSTILKLIEEGNFPPGKNITPGNKDKSRFVWSTIEIETWLDNRDSG